MHTVVVELLCKQGGRGSNPPGSTSPDVSGHPLAVSPGR